MWWRIRASPPCRYPSDSRWRIASFRGLRFLAGSAGRSSRALLARPRDALVRFAIPGAPLAGRRPAEIYAKEDLAYLIYSQFFPKLDLENRLTSAETARALEMWAKKYDPVHFPLGRVLQCDPVDRHMPGTGGRPDIGAYAVWHRLALSAESPELHGLALAADGNGLASFPIHRRETGSHKIGAPFDSDINKTIWDGMLGRRSAMTYERLGLAHSTPITRTHRRHRSTAI